MFDVVVVHKFNRFARNRYDSAIYKRQLKKLGIKVESVTQPLDDSPESVLMEALLEGMDEYYSLDLAREVMKGLREYAEQGIHAGGMPPYGFKINVKTRKLEIDQEKARAVRIYFEGVRDDIPLPVIAERLNNLGYRTQLGKKFTANSFATWAYNEKYIGNYIWNKTVPRDEEGKRSSRKKPTEEHIIKKGVLPILVDPELFWLVNGKMKGRQMKPGRMKAQVTYLLSGKIICGKCGTQYNANAYRKSKESDEFYRYYKCAAKCGNASVRKNDIEDIVIRELQKHCFSEEGAAQIVTRVKAMYQEHRQSTSQDIEPIQKEIKELDTSIENWIQAIGKGIKGLEDRIVEAQQRKELLEEELQRINIVQKQSELDDGFILKILHHKRDTLLSASDEDKKSVLQEYVDQIIIKASSDINNFDTEITFRVFKDVASLA
jgi:site-specific DNA recombinase